MSAGMRCDDYACPHAFTHTRSPPPAHMPQLACTHMCIANLPPTNRSSQEIADSADELSEKKMAASVSGVKSAVSNNGSKNYPSIPKIKIKFEGYSPDGTERVKRPKIVRTEEKQHRPASVVPGSKGQCLTCHQCRQSVYSNKGTLELKVDSKSGKKRLKCSKCTRYW